MSRKRNGSVWNHESAGRHGLPPLEFAGTYRDANGTVKVWRVVDPNADKGPQMVPRDKRSGGRLNDSGLLRVSHNNREFLTKAQRRKLKRK